MPQSTTELLHRLRKFVKDEAENQFQALTHQWSHPLQERVGRGWAIEGLHVTHFQNGIVRLTCTTNDSRFREGIWLFYIVAIPRMRMPNIASFNTMTRLNWK